MDILVVYGSPCSGKSTFVQDEITDNDLVFDYDLLVASVSNKQIRTCEKNSAHNAVLQLRKSLIDFATNANNEGVFYLITTYLSDDLLELLNNSKYQIKLIEASKEECIERLNNDNSRPDKDNWGKVIDEWFEKHNKNNEKGGETMKELKLKNGSIKFKASEDKQSAELYFFGDICSDDWEAWLYGGTCPQNVVDFLSEIDKYTAVDLHINSGGGDAFAGIAIYNILKHHNGKITTYIDGLAASAASVIAMAGDVIKMPTSAQLMIHQPWGMAVGNADEIRKYADSLDTCCQSIMAVYYENKAKDVEDSTLDELVKAETWLTAENAKQYFANIEIEEQQPIVACSSSYFAKYKNYKANENKTNNELELLKMQLKLEDY